MDRFYTLEYNHLFKRLNGKGFQANLYGSSSVGLTYGTFDAIHPLFTVALISDFETKRYYLYHQSEILYSTAYLKSIHIFRVGIVPVQVSYGKGQPWIILQAQYIPKREWGIAPILRIYNARFLIELGFSFPRKEPLFNFMAHI